MEGTLRDAFAGTARDVTEENIQARIRGNLLMALSNKRGALLLTTGNKSELAVGYCTLYGDMSGGLAVIADVPKTMVYRVARWLNVHRGTAGDSRGEPDQSAVGGTAAEPDGSGFAAAVRRPRRHPAAPHRTASAGARRSSRQASTPPRSRACCGWCSAAEFKRKQAAPGLKVTDRAFGTGWRMPIARSYELTSPRGLVDRLRSSCPGKPRFGSRRSSASADASTATAPDAGGRTSRARRCTAA